MPMNHAKVFPRHSFYSVLAGIAALYVFGAMMLVPANIYILPYLITPDFIHHMGATVVFFLAVPAAIYLICWQGSGFFAWLRAPGQLSVGGQGIRLGDRTRASADAARFRHHHNRNHVLLGTRDGRTLRLNLWNAPDALLAEVEEAVGATMARDVERRLHAGETVKFGALGLQAEGLVHKGQPIAWSSINTIRTQSDEEVMEVDEHLIIVAHGKSRKIDNEPVLMACLMQRLPAH